jgi:hypothetical protein
VDFNVATEERNWRGWRDLGFDTDPSFKKNIPSLPMYDIKPGDRYQTAEQLGKNNHSRCDTFCYCSERRFQKLPSYVINNLTCYCDQPYNVNLLNYWHLHFSLGGSYCATCLLPQRFSVADKVEVCDSCEQFYIPKPQRGNYPIRYRLCSNCDVDSYRGNRPVSTVSFS